MRKLSILAAIAHVLLCTLGALLVTTPIGFLVQRRVSFPIVRVAADSAALTALLFVAVVLVLGIAATALVGVPVWALARRWRAGAVALPTLAAASIASALFWLMVPFPFDFSEAVWLLVLQLTYFAVYFGLRAAPLSRAYTTLFLRQAAAGEQSGSIP